LTPAPEPAARAAPDRFIDTVVKVRGDEVARLLLAFAMFFSVLCGYYILRPVRDEMGVVIGSAGLTQLFLYVFLIMCAAVPVFGFIVARTPRRWVVPLLYGFFIANLIAFWMVLRTDDGGGHAPAVAATFFVWTSVFNLFVVSLFWILMSDIWRPDQAKRLYGFIAAGGTAGAVAGPFLAGQLTGFMAPHDLLLLTAGFFGLALGCALLLRHSTGAGGNGDGDRPAGVRDILSGAERVWQSPYLFRIAMFILLANLIGTFFYLEQSRIVGLEIADRADRVRFFAFRDLVMNVITVAVQVFATGRIMSHFGLGVPLASLPVCAIAGLLALAVSPTLEVIAAVMVAERAVGFALANPAIKVLYTVVDPDEKYKAQNFIDTVVFRGGDAASGWLFNSVAKAAGASSAVLAIISLPLALVWLATARDLARRQIAFVARDGQN
jgi:AAA family ATP:ADP antiporter